MPSFHCARAQEDGQAVRLTEAMQASKQVQASKGMKEMERDLPLFSTRSQISSAGEDGDLDFYELATVKGVPDDSEEVGREYIQYIQALRGPRSLLC